MMMSLYTAKGKQIGLTVSITAWDRQELIDFIAYHHSEGRRLYVDGQRVIPGTLFR